MVLTTLLTMAMQAAVPARSSAPHQASHQARSTMAARAKASRGSRLINQDEVFSEGNYPFWALRNIDEGSVHFRVTIDACKAIRQERFQPAAEAGAGERVVVQVSASYVRRR